MSINEIRALLKDIESDRVERTIFTTNTAVMVKEMKSPLGKRALQEAIARGFVTENEEKQTQKQPNLSVFDDKNGHKMVMRIQKNRQKNRQKRRFLSSLHLLWKRYIRPLS